MLPRLAILGNLENRRVGGFLQTTSELGWPPAVCLSYLELLENSSCLGDLDVDLLRVESPGENDEVSRKLIALGGGPLQADLEFGQVAYLSEYHRGFLEVLRWVGESGLPCLNSAESITVMFDKWKCHQRFLQNGLPRPQSWLAPSSFEEFAPLLTSGHGRLFLKPLHGSSASGVCALRWMPGRIQLISSVELERGRLFNSLKVRSYHRWEDIEAILTFLLSQGMMAERWIPKISTPHGVADLRVLVIAGKARHRVVRQSRHPMTNLHLGNRRGEESDFREQLGTTRWKAALELAEAAAGCFPDCLYAGVDILIDTRGRALIGEINAFGDLLPGLIHGGESAYQAIAENLTRFSTDQED